MNFAQRLSELVAESGLPKYKIGEAIGVSDSHIGALCAGKKELGKIDTAISLADFFGVSLDYLLCRSDERNGNIKKEPALDLSEDELDLLACFRRLDYKEQQRLIGNAQYAAASAASAQEGSEVG